MAEEVGKQYGLPDGLLPALVNQESGGNPNAKSPVGAGGLTQLMPGTAAGLGVTNVFDPLQNLHGGAKYLKEQLVKFGSVPLALAAYNAGPGAVAKYNGVPPYAETQRYVQNIMAAMGQSMPQGPNAPLPTMTGPTSNNTSALPPLGDPGSESSDDAQLQADLNAGSGVTGDMLGGDFAGNLLAQEASQPIMLPTLTAPAKSKASPTRRK